MRRRRNTPDPSSPDLLDFVVLVTLAIVALGVLGR